MRIRDANCEDLEKIKALCARNGLRGIVINSKIWKKEIDSCIQENTKIINLNNDIITIQTSTPAWKTELGFQKSLLLIIINKNDHN